MKPDSTQVALASQVAYAPFGPAESLTFGNGITETRMFDREGRLDRIASDVLDYGYARDATLLALILCIIGVVALVQTGDQ